jgi:hypothetical protein
MFSGLLSFLPTTLLYTDPGSGALLLQLIAASLLGGLFYLRKFKSKVVQLFSRRKPADPAPTAPENAN